MAEYEKSCGAVVFTNNGGRRKYLVILNKKGNATGHWGFPKGHTEEGEAELETAAREISEETGLSVSFTGNFRAVTTYSPREGVIKDSVYFTAQSLDENVSPQQSEVADWKWLEYLSARELVSNEGDKSILDKADQYLSEQEPHSRHS